MKGSIILAFASIILLFSSCDNKDENLVPNDLAVTDFVYKGLNLFYLYQADVPDLANTRFSSQSDLNNFLSQNSDPSDLFQNLLYRPISKFPIGQAVDRFSVIFKDYNELEGILQGTTTNNGVDFGLKYKDASQNEIFGYVRYILPNSDASNKNIQRGDIFYAVDGQTLNVNNYRQLLSQQSYTVNLADYDNGNITPNGQSVSLNNYVISENPVFITKTFNVGANKVGYLMYNGFYQNYEAQLNNAFAQLKSEGATHLVLDLRYNSGGSIATATRLASMITGQFAGQIFAKQQWNDKAQTYYLEKSPLKLFNFFATTTDNGSAINSLQLSKIYVLTTKSTASASELVINGLKPYIDVVQIGDATVGKNVGSITLYDSPTFGKKDLSTKHRYAMQPLVLKIVNRDNFGDYTNGLMPTEFLPEQLGNLGILGDINEPLLNAAIQRIINGGKKPSKDFKIFAQASDSKSLDGLRNQMYLEP